MTTQASTATVTLTVAVDGLTRTFETSVIGGDPFAVANAARQAASSEAWRWMVERLRDELAEARR